MNVMEHKETFVWKYVSHRIWSAFQVFNTRGVFVIWML